MKRVLKQFMVLVFILFCMNRLYPIGISYAYKHFVIDARYCFGVTKMAKESNRYEDVSSYLPYDDPNRGYTIQPLGFRGTNVRHSVFMLTVGYNISL